MYDVGAMYDVRCGMYDVGAMYDVRCGMYDVGVPCEDNVRRTICDVRCEHC
jgi:hypothetical protein